MLKTKSRSKDTTNQRNRPPRPSIPWEQVEELVNLAKNKLKLSYDNHLASELGLGHGTIGTWRRTEKCPVWFDYALRGLLNVKTDTPTPAISIGMRFTNDQLDLLNLALTNYSYGKDPNNPAYTDIRKVRSRVLLELASRLDEK